MPRYVILHHQTGPDYDRPMHWDFMLESHGVLRAWALAQPPEIGPAIIGQALPDHRIEYLEYEGPVSGNRGHVGQWDRGDYSLAEQSRDRLVVQLRGRQLTCQVTIERDRENADGWRFLFGG
jgi:hypothetical protein